ncbi:MAG: hypothetical protein K6B64_04515 [Acholeplasmatales bacterium]|nr:hypothetical protein [Acholeplasmatales bacterium]
MFFNYLPFATCIVLGIVGVILLILGILKRKANRENGKGMIITGSIFLGICFEFFLVWLFFYIATNTGLIVFGM